ncbi:hypothetical protein [Pedobacter aquae]|nr:hypothetical protein [Pedobacter aquae]
MLKTNFENLLHIIKELDEDLNKNEVQKEIQKVILEPRLSLKQLAAYPLASAKAKLSILTKAKYPGSYIPRFYEEARKIICNTFSSNYPDAEIYFEEFERYANILLQEAQSLDRDNKKNKICSSNALNEMRHLSSILNPILETFILNSNLKKTREHLYIQEVRIGCMADILIYENGGATLTGLLKFNFTKAPLKKREAENMLYIMKLFFERNSQVSFKNKNCILVDVFAHKLYISANDAQISVDIKNSCKEIRDTWSLITKS